MDDTGRRIKILRTNAGLTQEEFGKMFGIVKSTVSLYENGKSTPSDQIKTDICKHFGVSMDYLLGLSDNHSKTAQLDEQLETQADAVGIALSPEAQKIAVAFDKATAKEKQMVWLLLSEYMDDTEQAPVRIAALSSDGAPVDFSGADPDAKIQDDFTDGPTIP